ncbi:MAG: 16S rRNA (cytidine(1402)-2'-O)-methyltransferase [Gammaproteobacteria bacterium]|jgi:16S rRNA (cytidine1402-2'-O)-methyltransferase
MSLYIVATPIGNLSDISQRAIDTLQTVDLIAAEDTRHSAKLLQHFNITTKMLPLHDFNEEQQTKKILQILKQGQSIALISDAGTPLISDPGYRLVSEVRQAGIEVVPIPGACAMIAALSVSGLPSDKFRFEGFLPAKQHARLEHLKNLVTETCTLIFYESPHRILKSLQDMLTIFGEDRQVVIARELTKKFETIYDDNLKNLIKYFAENPEKQCGEFVVLVHGETKQKITEITDEDLKILNILLEELSVKQASHLAAKITGKKKNVLYKLALQSKG